MSEEYKVHTKVFEIESVLEILELKKELEKMKRRSHKLISLVYFTEEDGETTLDCVRLSYALLDEEETIEEEDIFVEAHILYKNSASIAQTTLKAYNEIFKKEQTVFFEADLEGLGVNVLFVYYYKTEEEAEEEAGVFFAKALEEESSEEYSELMENIERNDYEIISDSIFSDRINEKMTISYFFVIYKIFK